MALECLPNKVCIIWRWKCLHNKVCSVALECLPNKVCKVWRCEMYYVYLTRCVKCAVAMTNSVNSDQPAPSGAV